MHDDTARQTDEDATAEELATIADLQCPGCMHGSGPNDGCLKFKRDHGYRCGRHAPGTFLSGGIGRIMLGMPKGFNRDCKNEAQTVSGERTKVRIFEKSPGYDRCNVPVWAMEHGGRLFVRVYMPHLDQTMVHVITAGKFSDLGSGAIDVAPFIEEID